MKENAAIKAGALDDPKLRLAILNLRPELGFPGRGYDGEGDRSLQMFPWPGMRKTREEMVLREKEEAEFVLEEMRSTLRSEIKMTYAELASVRKQIEAVRRSQDVLKDIVGVTEETYAVGKGSQPTSCAPAGVRSDPGDADRPRKQEHVLSVRLNTLAALPADRPVPPLEDLPEIALSYGQADLVGIYESERPARKALQARGHRATPRYGWRTSPAGPSSRSPSPTCSGMPCPTDEALRHGSSSDDDLADLAEWKNRTGDPGDGGRKEMAGRDLANLDSKPPIRSGDRSRR